MPLSTYLVRQLERKAVIAAHLGTALSRGDVCAHSAIITDVAKVEVVVAHSERAPLRVGDVFLKIDSDQTLTDIEIEHGFDPSSRGAECPTC